MVEQVRKRYNVDNLNYRWISGKSGEMSVIDCIDEESFVKGWKIVLIDNAEDLDGKSFLMKRIQDGLSEVALIFIDYRHKIEGSDKWRKLMTQKGFWVYCRSLMPIEVVMFIKYFAKQLKVDISGKVVSGLVDVFGSNTMLIHNELRKMSWEGVKIDTWDKPEYISGRNIFDFLSFLFDKESKKAIGMIKGILGQGEALGFLYLLDSRLNDYYKILMVMERRGTFDEMKLSRSLTKYFVVERMKEAKKFTIPFLLNLRLQISAIVEGLMSRQFDGKYAFERLVTIVGGK